MANQLSWEASRLAAIISSIITGSSVSAATFPWTGLNSLANDPFFGGKNGNAVAATHTDEIATVTGRFGYAIDKILLYGKGGAAFARDSYAVNNAASINQAPLGCSTPTIVFTSCNLVGNADRWGWTAGAGAEWAFTPNWSAMIEYDHYGFDALTVSMNVVGNTFLVTPANLNIKHDIDTVKIGINYRFWAPAVARY